MSKVVGAVLGALALVVAGGVILGGGTWVGVGEIGIVKPMEGKVHTIGYGWNWVGYGVAVDKLPIGKQSLILSANNKEGGSDDTHWQIGTGDGQKLDVDTNFVWRIDPSKADQLYLSMGGKDIDAIQTTIVEPQMKNVVQSVTHQYSWSDIFGAKQAEVSQKINAELKADLEADGLIIDKNAFGFSHIEPPKGMADAQAQVAQAELKMQKAQADQNAAKIDNQTKIMNAEADAQVAIKQAQGKKATAEAINQYTIDSEWIAKWDGKLPSVQSGGSGSIINIPSLSGK